ncbi:uncharacterized protein cubi_02115 [Cryptosporidium ubiquitum]|uniref:Biotin-protein ligase N-terminal domain-containing protein n=1 Tax=Cryptosporidium ubiquitum TaxID=857276 RepID=A0A1J4MMV9_9CRYT|nr:uncharacterized protein cubi_02115 [Cryptosporidium ubiquitum]OII75594.1 hypothetical protein cubi_02115 [Cryptosporidium ubiquitum]
MKCFTSLLTVIVTLFCVFPSIFSMEHKSLRQTKFAPFTKVALFIEGFSQESVTRMKLTIQSGMEGAEIVELKLNDLKSLTVRDYQLFAAPSEVSSGSETIVKEGMGIISNLVKGGSFLFSHLDSSSPLCKEFDYDGVKTTNDPFIYNGLCKGPITNVGPMQSECRAITALVDNKNKATIYNNFYVNGGFYFEDAESKKNCKILARVTPRKNSQSLIEFRKNTDSKAVVVACKHGSGAAILSGIQLDQNKLLLANYVNKHPENAHVKEVAEKLSEIPDFSSSLLHFVAVMRLASLME